MQKGEGHRPSAQANKATTLQPSNTPSQGAGRSGTFPEPPSKPVPKVGRGQGQSHGGDGHSGLTATPARHTESQGLHEGHPLSQGQGKFQRGGTVSQERKFGSAAPSSRGRLPVLLSKLRLSATPSRGACSGATDLLQENPGLQLHPKQDGTHSAQFLIPTGTSNKIHPVLSTSEGSRVVCALQKPE